MHGHLRYSRQPCDFTLEMAYLALLLHAPGDQEAASTFALMDRELVVKRCPCRLELIQPILRPAQLEALKRMSFRGWSTKVLDATWPVSEGANGLRAALQRICDEATAAIDAGYEFIVLSDRNQGEHVG